MVSAAERLMPIPVISLTSAGWEKISKTSDLPPAARPSIESAISVFLSMSRTAYSPANSKNNIRDAERACDDLIAALQVAAADPLANVGLARVLSGDSSFETAMSDRAPEKWCADQTDSLRRLRSVLQASQEAILEARRGAHGNAVVLAMFVFALDEIKFEFTGNRLRRDSKGPATGRAFIAAVCDASGVVITPGSIDEALLQVMEGRKKARGEISSPKPG